MRIQLYALPTLFLLANGHAFGQCDSGELEVTIEVQTDQYGNETMWQLVPSGAGCNATPIFQGGNPAIDCSEAGSMASPPGGYASNSTVEEGPFCLTAGGVFDLISIDSFGDDQASFVIYVDGVYAAAFPGVGGGLQVYPFTVALPAERDLAILSSETSLYGEIGLPVVVAVTVKNAGASTITSAQLAYTLNGGDAVTETVTLDLAPGEQTEVEMSTTWVPTAAGVDDLQVQVTGVNGDTDMNTVNDAITRELTTYEAIPDLTEFYLEEAPTLTMVANGDQDIAVARDLDFHPDRSRNELWLINKDVFNTGGSTVRFSNPGEPDQEFLYQRDPAARHFLSLPTGIAMGDNNCFATCPGVYDANGNQSTATPFTGPTLWSADPAIYAQNQFGPLGSHLDMLHVTPRSQGIAHERWNRYWVVDGTNQDVVMHDFKGDHGPGQDYHGNAIIHRYTEVTVTRDPNNHIVSHCVMDKRTGWLYIVDHGGQRVLRLDTRTGNIAAGNPSFGPFESYVQYKNVTGATWEVVIDGGLSAPAGIEVVGNTLLVSDHGTGEIIFYDMNNDFAERGRVAVGTGVMGIKAGFDGRIWWVNATNSTLNRMDPANANVGVEEAQTTPWSIHPNPANTVVRVVAPTAEAGTTVTIHDGAGRLCLETPLSVVVNGLDVSRLPNGVYTVTLDGHTTQRLVIAR
ncbi:MAG: T9SS type A sorting domain-containing protein [Flavobacteriales bacterium]|nr:T9SS type A sorting domain-containing protein [Flavobacteriales bacterium]